MESSEEEPVPYRRDGRVAYITLSRPHVLNAFNDLAVRRLRDCSLRFDQGEDGWIAILHGNGRAFSSGADVHQRQLRTEDELRRLGGPSGPGASHHQITHGHVFGMAIGIVLRSEVVVADPEIMFAVTEVRRGAYAGHYWSLMQFRGAGTFADELYMTGRRFSATEAFDHGLITQASTSGGHMEAAEEFAQTMLERPPLTMRGFVRARRWRHLANHERDHAVFYEHARSHLTEDFCERARAFAEKREPRPLNLVDRWEQSP